VQALLLVVAADAKPSIDPLVKSARELQTVTAAQHMSTYEHWNVPLGYNQADNGLPYESIHYLHNDFADILCGDFLTDDIY